VLFNVLSRELVVMTAVLCWCFRRFVPSIRGDGVDVVIGVFKALCILGGGSCGACATLADGTAGLLVLPATQGVA
jgi:hypothetical protein